MPESLIIILFAIAMNINGYAIGTIIADIIRIRKGMKWLL